MRTLIFSLAAVVFCSITQPIQAQAQADAGQSSSFQGKYIRQDKTSDFMTLGPDGVFDLFLGGKLYGGTYKIEGDTLSVTGPRINRHLKETQITGNTIRDPLGTLWEKQVESSPALAPVQGQGEQAAPVGPYAAFAGEYLTKTSGQRFFFQPDGSCTISNPNGTQVPGQFIVDGDWIRVAMKVFSTNIPLTNFKIQGDKLYMNGIIDPAAELVRQGVPPAPAPESEVVAPPAPAQRQYEDVAPPPPPPAPAPTISMGQTKTQVTAAFGEPQRKAAAGPKEIYFYTDLKMKVTFTNGKVSSIE
jgi:hypothetical protein